MAKPKNFVRVFTGTVRRGPSPFRELDTDYGTRLGGVDFVQELADLDKRRNYYVELHNGAVRQAPDRKDSFSLVFNPLYRSDSNEHLTVSVGDADHEDRLEVDGKINILALINSRPNYELTLIVASSEDELDLSRLPKPYGDGYTD
jgi:hypothetical protein